MSNDHRALVSYFRRGWLQHQAYKQQNFIEVHHPAQIKTLDAFKRRGGKLVQSRGSCDIAKVVAGPQYLPNWLRPVVVVVLPLTLVVAVKPRLGVEQS